MKKIHKIVAFLLAIAVLVSAAVVTTAAVNTKKADTGAGGITVHYYCEGGTPNIYYWNSLPDNIDTTYPGPAMTAEGNNWYRYTFSGKTKINMLFVKNGVQSAELTRETGEWWYKNNRWYSKDPAQAGSYERTDMREDSIYFVIPTRFYDGDKSNNVHCWDDGKANNPDSDPAWRGDFKGLIQKLDYIKALGFSAIWVTPVVENASGYDYHGYHALDFSKIDPRYESNGATFQDLIDACHEKGIKLIQDVVWNHTGNWGENTLCPMFKKNYSKDLSTADCMEVIPGSEMANGYPNYANLTGAEQFQARLDVMQGIHSSGKYNKKAYYHDAENAGWGQSTEQTGSIEGDCRDLNTENQPVADYIYQAYSQYVDMGVDAFRLDTEKHINRWTLNSAYFPRFINNSNKNFFIFGEVCARWSEYINEGGLSDSPFFYTWKETDSKWLNNWSKTPSTDSSHNGGNIKLSMDHYSQYQTRTLAQTSSNAFLNGVNYHTPDYSKWNGTGVIDFTMHWNFENANKAFDTAKGEDAAFNDSTWNVTYVDSHDYAPDFCQKVRYTGGEQAWAENMDLMFTFRGIPCLYYGSEIEFQAGQVIDEGPNKPLSATGRAYFGDNIEGSVTASDFGKFTASGTVQSTLNKPLCKHLSQLNQIRRAVPALQKGQYTTSNVSGGNIAFTRRYTANGVDSIACVAISGGATFNNLPNGTYVDAVTGDRKTVSNGTLSVSSIGKANMRVYVKDGPGKIGTNGTYLK